MDTLYLPIKYILRNSSIQKKKIYSNRSKIHFRHICFEVKNIYSFAKIQK